MKLAVLLLGCCLLWGARPAVAPAQAEPSQELIAVLDLDALGAS